jgi:hypothetical protein
MAMKRRRLSWRGVLALCLVPAGCLSSASLPDKSSPPIRTDRDVYRPETTADPVSFTIMATYTNNAPIVRYVARCGGQPPAFSLEKKTLGVWRRVYQPLCPQVVSVPLEVVPGESVTETLVVHGWRVANGLPRFESREIPGEYRLVYEITTRSASAPAGGELLPKRERISNVFRISD